MRVRRADERDVDAIHQLVLAAFMPFRDRYTDDCFDATVLDSARIRQRMSEGPVLVAENGSLLGTVSLVRDDRGMYVRGMAVHPNARRLGAGRALLAEAESMARAAGAPCMWLSTTRFLAASQALYTTHGFAPSQGPPNLFGTPVVSFQKDL